MGKYDFDEVIDRHGTDCLKYDFGMKRKGRDDLLPLWVADMDFRLPDEILDEFHKRIDHGIFGYTDPLDEYFDAMNHWFFNKIRIYDRIRMGNTWSRNRLCTWNKCQSIYRRRRCHDGYATSVLSIQ